MLTDVDVNFALITNVGDVEQTPERPTNHNDSFLVFKHDRRILAAQDALQDGVKKAC